MGIEKFRTTASLNGNVLDTGSFQENQSPSSVNDGARELIRNIKQWYLDAECIEVGNGEIATTYTRVNGTQVTISSNVTSYYTIGRRVKLVDGTGTTLYGQITNVAFNSPNTTITMSFDGGGSIGSGTITSLKVGIVNPANTSIPSTSPTGSIVMWSGTSIIDGWLFADGSLKDKTAYPDLFAVLGNTYGTQTSSQFYLPNLQDRFILGKGSTYSTLGATGGSATVTPSGTNSAPTFTGSAFTPSGSISISGSTGGHALTQAELPSHFHYLVYNQNLTTNNINLFSTAQKEYAINKGNNGGMGSSDTHLQSANSSSVTADAGRSSSVGSGTAHSHSLSATGTFTGSAGTPAGSVSAPTFTGNSVSTLSPYITMSYIIKT